MPTVRAIVTRPAAQAGRWVQALQARGCQAAALPLISIAPPLDLAPVQAAWQDLARFNLVMFVSASAVQHFFDARPQGLAWPPGALAGSPGPGTSAALLTAGVPPDQLVQPAPEDLRFDSEALWVQLRGRPWQGRQALIVRGEQGRDWLADTLRAAGTEVAFVAAYRRLPPQPDAQCQELLAAAQAEPADYVWVFSSSEAVGHLRGLCPDADWSTSRALASHPRIAQAARTAGFGQVDLVSPTAEAVAQRLASLRPGAPLQSGPS